MKIAFFSKNRSFCGQLIEELRQHHKIKIWHDHPNDKIGRASVLKLLDWCDLGYLEWLQPPNLEISQIQGIEKPLVAFCHGVDAMNHHFMNWENISALIVQDALYPRLIRLRQEWEKRNPDRPPLAKLPKTLIKSLGIDLKTFMPPFPVEPEYHIAMHASFIRPTKRIYAGIQQFYDLIWMDEEKPWKLTIVGTWEGGWKSAERQEYLIACNELIEQLGFPPDRLFLKLGSFPRDIWAKWLKTIDLYWCTSWRESFGASMAEACATGVYPVVNWYLGAEKVYPEKYLCKSPAIMIEKTIEWGRLDEKDKLRERCLIREHIEQYDSVKAAEEIRLFLEEIEEAHRQ